MPAFFPPERWPLSRRNGGRFRPEYAAILKKAFHLSSQPSPAVIWPASEKSHFFYPSGVAEKIINQNAKLT